jgi:hypothetical protein
MTIISTGTKKSIKADFEVTNFPQKFINYFFLNQFMKKVMMCLFLGIFVLSFIAAQYGEQEQDGTGPYHDAVIAAGGMNGTDDQFRENQEIRTENREQIRDGNYSIDGKELRIEKRDEMRTRLEAKNISAETKLELQEGNSTLGKSLRAILSNGKFADIKIMPDVASETALQRLRIRNCNESNNCSIELKEVGQGNMTRAAYEVRVEKQSKILGLFRAQMQVQSQIDAENGNVIAEKKPWWSFLAKEQDETTTEGQ